MEGIKESLGKVEDFRMDRCKKHELLDILFVVLFGYLYGYTDIESIAEFAEDALEELRRYIPLKNGAPSADTIHRVMRGIDSGQLERAFVSWTSGVFKELRLDGKNEIVAIDGKTIRGSNNEAGKKGIHIVSAWADEINLVLGQVKTAEKSNEITAVPELLELLDLRGVVVTADAMGCQKAIARKVAEKKSDYVFSLKGNQSSMHDSVKEFFGMDEKGLDKYGVVRSEDECNCGEHGRHEKRRYYMCTDLSWLEGREDWEKLRAVVMAVESRSVNGVEREDRRYFLTSLDKLDAAKNAIRRHWGIENRLHWCLDMSFREDLTRSRKDNSPQNLAVMRKVALNMLRMPELPEGKKQESLNKRKIWFSLRPAFRLKVLQAL